VRWRHAALAVLLVTAGLAGCIGDEGDPAGEGSADENDEPRQPAIVAAARPQAAKAGAEILRQGGNAVDAAVATQLALNVVEPNVSGIGGGLFMLVYLEDANRVVTIDGRETAAAGTQPDQYENSDDENPDWMGYSVGVPGTLAAMHHALTEYGTMDLNATTDPAIQLAEDGFKVYPYLSQQIAQNWDELASWPASADKFLVGAACLDNDTGCVGGAPLPPGSTLTQPDLADAFETLAQQGPSAFYGGSIGESIVDTVQEREGPMTLEDLEGYEAIERRPLNVTYEDRSVLSAPPPSGGTIVLETLGILDGMAAEAHDSAADIHRVLEALKLAYADRRAHVADPAFVDVPTEGLLDPAYLDERRDRIGPDQANPDPQPGDPWAHEERNDTRENGTASSQGRHTSHFVVADHEGNVVSVTTTIESAFGNGQVVPGHGFLLNDELTDFTWETGEINSPAPNKRPRSSMSPSLVLEEGEPVMAVGSPGGLTIPSSVVEVVRKAHTHGLRLEDAVETSRQYPLHPPPEVYVDRQPPAETLQGLQDRGHEPRPLPQGIGNVHAIQREPGGGWSGWADTRRGQGGVVTVPPNATS